MTSQSYLRATQGGKSKTSAAADQVTLQRMYVSAEFKINATRLRDSVGAKEDAVDTVSRDEDFGARQNPGDTK